MPYTKAELLKCVDSEIGMRNFVYPGRVANRKMSQAKADREIAMMQAVRQFIKDRYPDDPAQSEIFPNT